jgi:hypothetical protein
MEGFKQWLVKEKGYHPYHYDYKKDCFILGAAGYYSTMGILKDLWVPENVNKELLKPKYEQNISDEDWRKAFSYGIYERGVPPGLILGDIFILEKVSDTMKSTRYINQHEVSRLFEKYSFEEIYNNYVSGKIKNLLIEMLKIKI